MEDKPKLGLLHIDIETTGLNKNVNNVIQLAAIYDDLISPLNELKTFEIKICHAEYTIGEYCYHLHATLLPMVMASGHKSEFAYSSFAQWLKSLKVPKNTFTLSGKNVASFDLPFLQANPYFNSEMEEHGIKFRHRVFDIGSVYALPSDEVIPDLKLCCQRGRISDQVSHTALDDCWMTVKLARTHFGVAI